MYSTDFFPPSILSLPVLFIFLKSFFLCFFILYLFSDLFVFSSFFLNFLFLSLAPLVYLKSVLSPVLSSGPNLFLLLPYFLPSVFPTFSSFRIITLLTYKRNRIHAVLNTDILSYILWFRSLLTWAEVTVKTDERVLR